MREAKTLDPDDLDRPDWNSLKANYDKHDVGEAYFVGRAHQMGLHVEHWGIDMRDHDESLIFDNKMDLRLWEPLDGQESTPPVWPSETVEGQGEVLDTYGVTTLDGSVEDYERAVNLGVASDVEPHRFDTAYWELRGMIDVKTKANEDWLGKMNLRHLVHYADHADRFGVPTAVYFTMVDMDAESVGERNIIVPVPTDWPYEDLLGVSPWDDDVSWPRMRELAVECPPVRDMFRAPDGNAVVEFEEDAWLNFDWIVEHVL